MNIIEAVNNILKEYALCDNCLGRQFALLGYGLTNEERGRALKLACIMDCTMFGNGEEAKARTILSVVAANGFSEVAAKTLETLGAQIEEKAKECYLCGGAFNYVDELAESATTLLQYDYDSFLVGIRAEAEIEDREDELRSKFGLKWGENIRNEFSRELGKRISKVTKKSVDLRRPNILILVNPFKKKIVLEVNSLFIAGRYRKLVRGIPQSRWVCRECRGRGCRRCNWSGKMYSESIEELIVTPLLEVTKGRSAKLHASGREDIDVRMLGSGRPFIAEAKKPHRRKINLEELRKTINLRAEGKIEISALEFSSKEEVKKLKGGEKTAKVYRAVVEFARDLNEDDIQKIGALAGSSIVQQTPLRVVHRRAMKKRKKYLYGIDLKKMKPNLVELMMRCEGGLYVKEMINGDNGRTKPNISEVIGASAKCVELDVMEVELEGF